MWGFVYTFPIPKPASTPLLAILGATSAWQKRPEAFTALALSPAVPGT